MTINGTLWPLEPHTKGKHQVLKRYLQAWYPILGFWQGRILFVDGFAGPGQYQGGEDGSPLIAIKTLSSHSFASKIKAEVVFLFIERDEDRAAHLEGLLQAIRASVAPNFQWEVFRGDFGAEMTSVFDALEAQQTRIAPSFVMIDPFGVSDTPMSVIQRIFQNQRCEVYISFMYESINRFKETPAFETHLDALFGCGEWRQGAEIKAAGERKTFLCGLYESQIRKAGAQYVVHFDLYEGNRLVYSIFFGTQNEKGCNAMKEAIWKVDPIKGCAFRGSRSHQPLLNLGAPDFSPLQQALRLEFGGRGWIRKEVVESFVQSDRTEFYLSQLRKGALIPMENRGELEVADTPNRKRGTYPAAARLRFLGPSA